MRRIKSRFTYLFASSMTAPLSHSRWTFKSCGRFCSLFVLLLCACVSDGLYDATRSYSSSFVVAGCLLLVAGLVAVPLRRVQRRELWRRKRRPQQRPLANVVRNAIWTLPPERCHSVHSYIYHAAVLIGCITGFARPSVWLSVPYGLLTREKKQEAQLSLG